MAPKKPSVDISALRAEAMGILDAQGCSMTVPLPTIFALLDRLEAAERQKEAIDTSEECSACSAPAGAECLPTCVANLPVNSWWHS